MQSNLLESIVQRLNALPFGAIRALEGKTGLAYDTILRIKRGDITNPRIDTLERIAQALNEEAAA